MAHTVKKIVKRNGFSLRVLVLGWGLLINLLLLVIHSSINKCLQTYTTPIYIKEMLISLENWISILFNLSMTLSGVVLITWLINKLLIKENDNPFKIVCNGKLDYWFQTVGVFVNFDNDHVLVPNVRKIKVDGIWGFEIEILGDHKKKMIELNESLNVFLAQKGSTFRIIESYELNGWIRYILSTDISKDQIGGDELGL